MPASDLKITALTAIGANPVNPATFPIPMVDLLDNSMAASGTTKKVTVNQILGAGGTATLASATITGAATVGTTLGVTGVSTLASAVVTGALTSGSTTLVAHAAGYTGKVGIGTATPATNLHIINDTAATNSAVDVLTITQSSTGTAAAGLGGGVLFKSERPSGGLILNRGAIYGVSGTDPDDDGDLAFYTLTDTGPTGFTEKVRINAIGNIVMKTANTGIDFSINSDASATSELLNDYEEGTWTIVVNDQLGNSATVASQIARYVKIGRRVSVFADFTLSAKGSAGGGSLVYLGTLPFAPVATCFEGSVVHRYDNTTLTTNGQINIMSAAGGNTVCLFPVSSATTGTSFLTFTQITNTTRFVFNFSYDV